MKDKMKNRIKKSLVESLENEPFESLTVTKLCGNAGITRASFYKYYKNTADVLQDLKDDFFSKIDPKKPIREVQIDVLKQIRDNRTLAYIFFTSSNPVFKENEAESKALQTLFEERIRLSAPDKEEAAFLFDNFRVSSYAILLNWIRNGCRESEEKMADYILGTFLP